jgi:membrane protein
MQGNRATMISKVINFIKTDIWRIRLGNISRTKSFLIKQLRIILLALRGFDEDKIHLRASALTFYTLLSIVPVAAVVFGIAKGFGFEERLQRQLLDNFPGHEEVLTQIIGFAHSLLVTVKGGIITGIGLAAVFWVVIKVLGNIERSFNDIWGIKESRSFGRKFSDYLAIMLIAPILVFISTSMTVFLTTQIILITQKVALLKSFGFFASLVVKLIPYCVVWAVFTFMYILVPYTKVKFTSGVSAGLLAGTAYQVAQWAYITFQVGVAKYNAIYGSFAALPLFLMWLQLSWLIVLFGAEISFAHQNVHTYEFEPDSLHISHSFKNFLSLAIAHLLIKRFSKGEKPLTATQISHALDIPIRLVRQILYELVETGVLSSTNTDDYHEPAYQPARDISLLTIGYIIEALERRGVNSIPVVQTEELKALSESFEALWGSMEKSPANRLLKDI